MSYVRKGEREGGGGGGGVGGPGQTNVAPEDVGAGGVAGGGVTGGGFVFHGGVVGWRGLGFAPAMGVLRRRCSLSQSETRGVVGGRGER